MSETFAHETLFPHIHPHSQFSTLEDLALTVLFLAIVFVLGRLFISAVRKLSSKGP